MEIEEIENSD